MLSVSLLGRHGAEASNRYVFGDTPIAREAIDCMSAVLTHVRPRFDNMPLLSDDALRRLTITPPSRCFDEYHRRG